MRQSIVDMWNTVMNADYNPLKNIPIAYKQDI